MIGNKEYDCKEMFRHACAFCEVADMAMHALRHKTADIEKYVVPSIVNSAFASEIFLKSLLKWHNIQFQKVHRLKSLYAFLPENLQAQIKQMTSYGFKDMWTDPINREYLELVSNAFQEWRYCFEHDFSKPYTFMDINTGFLANFRNALRDVCCQLFYGITWDEYKRG